MNETNKSMASFRHAVILLLGSCLPVMATVLIAPILPQIMRHFSATPNADALVPLALTVPALIIGICAPIVGIVIDRAGRKKLLLAGMVLYSVFGTAPLYLDSLAAIIVSRAAVGLTEAIIMTACTSLIADYFSGPLRERYLAQQTMWASVSATLFFGIGGALGEGGWRMPFWMYLAALLLVPVMAAMLWEPKVDHSVKQGVSTEARRRFPLKAVLGICVITFGSALAFYTLPVHLGFVLHAIDVTSPAMIGMATAAGSVATVIGAVSSRRLAMLGVAGCLAIAFGTLGAGFIVVGTAASLAAVVVGAVIHGFGAGLALPTLLTWLMRQLRFEERGRGSGAFTANFFSGQFICPLVVLGLGKLLGGLGPALGGLGWLLAVAAMLAVCTAVFLRPATSLKLPSSH
ncbi:MFS transporter [Noviherbaspirillum saxi]|uniref:MFS transporter n=1 Tax=Noviherbaspirillum saxi TaxID=2320863 RepID=A0A3A3FQE3_9BURK|nr:MFS transporter [Noviherbaspirillum saxi]RJF95682.1 MFS transporter [Noviherbaspirillum saxi]